MPNGKKSRNSGRSCRTNLGNRTAGHSTIVWGVGTSCQRFLPLHFTTYATAAGHSDLVDHICLVPDSADFDTSCPNTLDFANPGPAHVPPADDAMFELQCRDPANASHTGVTLTKTVAWGTLTAMGYPYVNMCYRAAIMILFRSISPSF